MNGAEPAFPEVHISHWKGKDADGEHDHVLPRWRGGLTKREYFAAMAMQGYAARTPWQNIFWFWRHASASYKPEWVAKEAIACADALIAELSK